jgi:hypothetical protein
MEMMFAIVIQWIMVASLGEGNKQDALEVPTWTRDSSTIIRSA